MQRYKKKKKKFQFKCFCTIQESNISLQKNIIGKLNYYWEPKITWGCFVLVKFSFIGMDIAISVLYTFNRVIINLVKWVRWVIVAQLAIDMLSELWISHDKKSDGILYIFIDLLRLERICVCKTSDWFSSVYVSNLRLSISFEPIF